MRPSSSAAPSATGTPTEQSRRAPILTGGVPDTCACSQIPEGGQGGRAGSAALCNDVHPPAAPPASQRARPGTVLGGYHRVAPGALRSTGGVITCQDGRGRLPTELSLSRGSAARAGGRASVRH
eukprot:scaffold7242_cov400-Prasinococcus_capsulatus_cf.AAC.15